MTTNISGFRDKDGNEFFQPDSTARANALTAIAEAEYNRQALSHAYGGQNLVTLLGAASTDAAITALHSRASAANFAGLRVGDYIDVDAGVYGTRRFVIADFDPYYQCGDTAMGHNICFVDSAPVSLPSSDSLVTNSSYLMWNATATNQGTADEECPYLASRLHDWEINNFLPALPSTLRSYMLERRELLEQRYSASGSLEASTGWTWKSMGKIWSLAEIEVYGCVVWGTPGYTVGTSRQLEYFRNAKHQLNGSRVNWWLRSVSGSSSSGVCNVGNHGTAYRHSAANTWFRPRCGFLLG